MNALNSAVATAPHRPRAAPLSAREYKLIRDVRALHDEVNELMQAVIRSGGKWSTNALRANLAAVEAAQAIWADTLAEEADNTASELPGYHPAEGL